MTENDQLKEEIIRARTERREEQEAEKEAKNKKIKKFFSYFLVVLLWCALAYGGYIFAEHQLQLKADEFSEQVNEFLQENQRIGKNISESLASLEADILRLQDEMGLLKEELELASESITGTTIATSPIAEKRITRISTKHYFFRTTRD